MMTKTFLGEFVQDNYNNFDSNLLVDLESVQDFSGSGSGDPVWTFDRGWYFISSGLKFNTQNFKLS